MSAKLRTVLVVAAVVASVLAAVPPSAVAQGPVDTAITVDGAAGVGAIMDVALDSSGRPVLAYSKADIGELLLLRCSNVRCDGTQTPVLLDASVGTETSISLALDSLDRPVIAYYDDVTDDLNLIRCSDPECSGGVTPRTLDGAGDDVGRWPSLVLDDGDRPAIAYHDATDGDLVVLRCVETDCSDDILTPITRVTGASDGGIDGRAPSMVLDDFDQPVISYFAAGDGGGQSWMVVLRCSNRACGQQQNLAVVGLVPGPIAHSSIALGRFGLPVVAFRTQTGELQVVRCSTRTCLDPDGDELRTGPVQTPLDGETIPDVAPALFIDTANDPVIAVGEIVDDGELSILHCTTSDCRGAQQVSRPDPAIGDGVGATMALDEVGDPVVFHRSDLGLRLVRCADPAGCGGRDQDRDGVTLAEDNCPRVSNPTQSDLDEDGRGDACDRATRPTSPLLAPCRGMGPLNPIVGTNNADILRGTPGNDVILGRGGDDVIDGRGGNDCILGGNGNDLISGGPGADRIFGGRGSDTLVGGRGPDLLDGQQGNDACSSRPNDTVVSCEG